MTPFDLKDAKAGKSICTRRGKAVRFIAHVSMANPDQRVVVLDDGGEVLTYHDDGVFDYRQPNSTLDLFMEEA